MNEGIEALTQASRFAFHVGGGSALSGALIMLIGTLMREGTVWRKIVGGIGFSLLVFGFLVGWNGVIAAWPGVQATITAAGP